jgi:hypothetical protein
MPNDRTDAEIRTALRMGAHQSWANTADRTARTRPARVAFEAKFANESERKAWFLRLSLAGQAAYRAKREAAAAATARTAAPTWLSRHPEKRTRREDFAESCWNCSAMTWEQREHMSKIHGKCSICPLVQS